MLIKMNGKKFLLDTNIIIAFFKQDLSVINHIKDNVDFFIPAIVLGELYFGAEKSEQKISNIEKINRLSELTNVIACDNETAKIYGKIKNQLQTKGTPIPENDIWIAAVSEQHKLTLFTRDKHFKLINKLKTVKW